MATAAVVPMEQPAEVASKVLRRAQVSKMTRALQSRLALANIKTKHGWENLSIDTLEPKIDLELKRKRPGSSHDVLSDSSSIISDRYSVGQLESSPLGAPLFSDQIGRSGGSARSNKRLRHEPQNAYPGSSNHARTRVRTSTGSAQSWKSLHRLPESSPVYHRRHAHFTSSHAPSLSFVSETSTVPDETTSPVMSEDDDEDLPLHSFQIPSSNIIRSSPPSRSPRTPPPALARSARLRNDPFNPARNTQSGEEEASLLMFLATSPSPAKGKGGNRTRLIAPSTPPPKNTPLPSSMMSTPGGGALTGFGMTTPGAHLNFADFVNMTPSPAQIAGSWARTPIPGKTPLTARDARRRITYESLVPPTDGSPTIGSSLGRVRQGKIEGLGMDLGGELVS